MEEYLKANCPGFDERYDDRYHKLSWMIIMKKVDNPIKIGDDTFTLVVSSDKYKSGDDICKNYGLVHNDKIVYKSALICG